MEIEVKGHSGCQIELKREENDLFVYKSSCDKKYFPRLLKQAQKQQKAFQTEYQHIRIPQIYKITEDDKHVSVKMEYVYSKNFIEYFESAGFEQIAYLIKALILFLEKELKESYIQTIDKNIVLNKFFDVKEKINSNELLNHDRTISEIIAQSHKIFDSLNEIKIPVGTCHGDLTFSNILFNGNNYYLIDFLDSFIESPLLDVVKIRQDSAHQWSKLMYTKNYDELRLEIVSSKIDREIDSYFQRYEWYTHFYKIFQLMNMLRILQYAKEEKVINYLKNEIIKIIQ